MRTFIRASVMGLMGLAAVTLAACQTTPSGSAMGSSKAVKCSKCEVTYVNVPTVSDKNRAIGYQTKGKMECPECKTAAENFFATGKLGHSCTHCGTTLETCEGH